MPDRLDRYFAQEAAEYLDGLDELLTGPGLPDLEELLRLSKGVRGSAQMAGAESVASVAERLEDGIRSVQSGHVAWSEEIRRLSRQTVADLKILVRASGPWGEVEEMRVRSAIERWGDADPSPDASRSGDMHLTWHDELPSPARRAGGRSPAPVVSIESLFYDDAGPHVVTPESENDMDLSTAASAGQPVPIETLLLDRDSALQEALAMRDTIERMLREVPGAEVELASIVRELFELLETAAEGVPAAG